MDRGNEKGERGPREPPGRIEWRPRPRRIERILFTKYVQIPITGIIKETAEFPLSAESSNIQVHINNFTYVKDSVGFYFISMNCNKSSQGSVKV